ncbi:MAG: hypothetical protein N2235_25355 [Fischerella sp.]|nr:hypothetical protein [Fischerella sp.]
MNLWQRSPVTGPHFTPRGRFRTELHNVPVELLLTNFATAPRSRISPLQRGG